MINPLKIYCYLCIYNVLLLAPYLLHAQVADEDDDIVELSPFTIEEDEAIGYQATNTLAGSRLSTPLRDVGSAIQVITEVLFEDTGSTTMEEILPYALNTESHGLLGNFAGGPGQNHNGRFEQDTQRLNPQDAQRVRGLAEASLTRDFFLTEIPFESYNTARIAVQRGANSLLFGIGSPGGIINNTTKRATADGEDFGEISVRIGERGSHRESFDYHDVLIENRLAVRVMGLYKDTVYQQKPAFELDRRIDIALEAVLFENEASEFLERTRFRANYEKGSIQGTPPNIIPPTDAFTSFFQPPDIQTLQNVPGVVIPGYYLGTTETNRYHPEFGLTSWQPKQTFDNRLGLSRGNVPAVVERNFHRTKIKFNDIGGPITYVNYEGGSFPATHGAARGATGTVDANGNPVPQGEATHVIGVDGNPYPVLSNIWEYIESGSFFMGNRNDQRIPNFTTPVILDRGVWDNDAAMIQGLTNFRDMEFQAETFVLEQPLFEGEAGLEIVYDNQHYERDANIPFSEQETIGDSGNADVVIDLNEYLITGEPNPNVGRPHMKTDQYPANQHQEIDRESMRFTGFFNVDFEKMGEDGWLRWLGRHTVTGLYNEQTIDNFNRTTEGRLRGVGFDLGDPRFFARNAGIRHADFRPVYEVYLGPDVRQFSNPSQVELSMIDIVQPKAGDNYDILLWDRENNQYETGTVYLEDVLVGGGRSRQEIDTEVISIQSRFLDDHLVGLVGWRDDTQRTFPNISTAEGEALGIDHSVGGAAGTNTPRNPDFFRISDNYSEQQGDTFTWSAVGHVPDNFLGDLGENLGISLHVSESENFQVSATRRDVRGNILGPPEGTTEEYGITFNVMNNKLVARLNWYETAASNATISGGTAFGFFGWISGYLNRWQEASDEFSDQEDPFAAAVQASIDQGLGGDLDNPNFQSFRDVYDEIISWLPSDVQSVRQLSIDDNGNVTSEPNPGESSTQDFVTEGFEVDLTANLTENWRLFLNIGQQESVVSNIALPMREVTAEVFQNIQNSPISDWADTPSRSEGQTFESRFIAIVGAPLNAIAARDGQLAQELREWRVNAVTSYSFTEGFLRGYTVGGGVRWQDNNAIGYPNKFSEDGEIIPDLGNPFFGPSQLNGDVFASYQKPILDGKVDWKIQFNFRNAFGDNDPIPVVVNPDGKVAVIRNAQQKTLWLTNTFSF